MILLTIKSKFNDNVLVENTRYLKIALDFLSYACDFENIK